MERYQRYRKYKLPKCLNASMTWIRFQHLHANINNAPIEHVYIIIYREDRNIVIYNHSTPGIGFVISANLASIDINTDTELTITLEGASVRILFSGPNERLLFLNEIQSSDSSSSGSEKSGGSGNLSH